MKIIYKQDDGVLAIITLADETNIIDNAPQYVPNGKKYKIIEDDDLPEDLTYRDAWTISDDELSDGVGVMS